MKVRELYAILHVAMVRHPELSELDVAATINPEASTSPDDLAYGDIDIAGPNYTGRVFGITAIKGEFPEALEKPLLAAQMAATLEAEQYAIELIKASKK